MLFGQEVKNATGRRSRVVDQNIDAPKRGVRLLDKSLSIGRLGQIGRYGDDFAVCLARNLRRRCLERLLAPRADRDIDALASQGKGDCFSNPGTSAGDECCLPGHLEIHKASLKFNTSEDLSGSAAGNFMSIDSLI